MFQAGRLVTSINARTGQKKVKVLWLQLGIICEKVKAEAEALGIQVVMDKCIKIEHARLFGGLNFMGVNTKVISSKRSRIVFN